MLARLIPLAVTAVLAACTADSSPSSDAPRGTGAGTGTDTLAGATRSGSDAPGAGQQSPAAPGASLPAGGSTQSTAACVVAPITGDSVGALRIGATIAEVRARCAVVRDTTVPGPEGQPSRRIAVVMDGDTVEAEIVDGRVWRIPVTSTRLRTADGIGVGTPLARLLDLRDVRPAMGEGLYVLTPAHCGLSFQLRTPEGSPPPAASTAAQLRRLPAGTVVSRVLVTGCRR